MRKKCYVIFILVVLWAFCSIYVFASEPLETEETIVAASESQEETENTDAIECSDEIENTDVAEISSEVEISNNVENTDVAEDLNENKFEDESEASEDEYVEAEGHISLNREGALTPVYYEANGAAYASNTAETQLKQRMIASLESSTVSINISDLNLKNTEEDLKMMTKVLQDVLNSSYRYFYLASGYGYSYNKGTGVIQRIELQYASQYVQAGTVNTPDTGKIAAHRQTLDQAVREALGCVAPGMSEAEVMLALHDYLAQNCSYDYENYMSGTVPDASYSIWGALVEGKAVCQGYAEAYANLLSELGISSYMVTSRAMNHAWNLVQVNGSWYHVDVTFDDPVMRSTYYQRKNNDYVDEGHVIHSSFLKSDTEIRAAGHQKGWDDGFPAADVSHAFDNYCFFNVAGHMNYNDGFWYFLNENDRTKLVRSRIDGSERSSVQLKHPADYVHRMGDKLYFSHIDDGIYAYDPASGEESLYADIKKDFSGYRIYEFAVKHQRMVVVLYDEAAGKYKYGDISSLEKVPQEKPGETDKPGETEKPQESEKPEPETPVYTPVEQFVRRLYINVLNREPDPEGFKAWTRQLVTKANTGAKASEGFIYSEELKKRNLSNDAYVEMLYVTFLDRASDAGGKASWIRLLENGVSRAHLFKGFVESEEFTKICRHYGIERGNVEVTEPRDQNSGVTMFVWRCYKKVLGRDADIDGLNAWVTVLLNKKETPEQVAKGFVFSKEQIEKNLSDTEYVKMLYEVFLDRQYDEAGLNAWVRVLKRGGSREEVFYGFSKSVEFKKIVESYGL